MHCVYPAGDRIFIHVNFHYHMSTLLKKLTRLRWVLALFLPGLIYFSAFQSNFWDQDTQNAQQWFQQTYPAPTFWEHPVSLNWNSARKVVHNGRNFFEVPLSDNTAFTFGIGNLNQSDTIGLKANGRLKVVIAQDSAGYRAYYLQVSGTKNYVDANGASKVLQTNFDQIQSDFTGTMEYFSMAGQHVDGWYFENGVAKKVLITRKPEQKAAAMDRCLTCTQTTTFWQIVVSTGGYVNTYYETSSTINCSAPTFLDCYDPPFLPPGYYYYPWQNFANPPGSQPGNLQNETPCYCNPYQERFVDSYLAMIPPIHVQFYGNVSKIDCQIPTFSGNVVARYGTFDSPGVTVTDEPKTPNAAMLIRLLERYSCGCKVKIRHLGEFIITYNIISGYSNGQAQTTQVFRQPHKVDKENDWVLSR